MGLTSVATDVTLLIAIHVDCSCRSIYNYDQVPAKIRSVGTLVYKNLERLLHVQGRAAMDI